MKQLLCFALLVCVRVPVCANEPAGQLAPEVRQRCIDTLQEAVRSAEFWPAMHAAEALTLAGAQSEVVAALGDRLPAERDDQHRCGLGANSCVPATAVNWRFCSTS